MYINVAGEIYDSLVNGPGMRYVIFFQGCIRKCRNCHNKHTWERGIGRDMSIDEIMADIANSVFVDGITISGGEPFLQAKGLSQLCKRIKKEFPHYTIMIYTGYKLEELKSSRDENIESVLKIIDYLADGEYQCDNPTSKKYVGSDNQRIFDMKAKKEILF